VGRPLPFAGGCLPFPSPVAGLKLRVLVRRPSAGKNAWAGSAAGPVNALHRRARMRWRGAKLQCFRLDTRYDPSTRLASSCHSRANQSQNSFILKLLLSFARSSQACAFARQYSGSNTPAVFFHWSSNAGSSRRGAAGFRLVQKMAASKILKRGLLCSLSKNCISRMRALFVRLAPPGLRAGALIEVAKRGLTFRGAPLRCATVTVLW
jgi:hypothetical protein